MKNVLLLIVFCSVLSRTTRGQSTIGTPAIRNYNNTDYHSGMGVWDIGQDKNGILYFAGDEGLMTFDGSYWKIYPLPNKAAIKSLALDDSGRIYVGGQDEVGYFVPDAGGILTYHSIKQLLPPVARQFADIWDIVAGKGPAGDEQVVFRTVETIFQYADNTLRTFDAPGGWLLLKKAGGTLFADDKTKGLLSFEGNGWRSPCSKQPTEGLQVTGVMEYGRDTLLLTTLKNGLYLLCGATLIKKPSEIDGRLENDLINCAHKIGPDRFALGTHANGLYIIDHNGRLIRQYAGQDGLQNNNVLRIFPDRDGNLWLALENGASFINYTSAVQHIRPAGQNHMLSNAVRISGGRLYIGTSNGLYSVPVRLNGEDLSTQSGLFTKVPGTEGQVYSLTEIDHKLLLGHGDGAMLVKAEGGAVLIPFPTPQGVWDFAKTSPSGDIIAGTYTGLRRLEILGDGLKDGGRASDLYESLGNLAADGQDNMWSSHPYRGLFRTPIGKTETEAGAGSAANAGNAPAHSFHYTTQNGLPSDLQNYVYFIRHRIVAATTRGVYAYNRTSNRFSPDPFFQPMFGNSPMEYLAEDSSGNIWFVSDRRVGVIDFSKGGLNSKGGTDGKSGAAAVIYFPELSNQTVKGSPFIYPYDPENVFIGSYDGIFHLNYKRYAQSDSNIQVLLSGVKILAEKDSLVFGGYFPNGPQPVQRFPNHWNSFRFEYSSTLYAQKANVEFSYRLEGFDPGWSAWSARTEKEYTNLPYGTYTFGVRARNNLGNTSQPVRYTFTVDPAWYQTVWAYLFYGLLFAAFAGAVIKWQQRRFALHQKRHEAEQERLSYLHSLEMDRKEKGIMALQNEKLEAELQFKNKELATVTMHLVERGGILSNIREELIAVIKKLNISHQSFEFKSVFRMLTDTEKSDDDWNRFALYFDQVHNNFLGTLKAKFPTLSATDLKLCAYLRLNLSSKEIAQLLNISLKGVEISRYRIRKKFQLKPETNLYDFLIEVTG